MRVLGNRTVTLAKSRLEAETLLWDAGDSPTRFDNVHLVSVNSSRSALTPELLFKTHCKFRPNESRTGTLQGFGQGWSGGILFIGCPAASKESLVRLPPFDKLTVGHDVLCLPCDLDELLQSLLRIQPIYPERWKQCLAALRGLTRLKSKTRRAQATCSDSPEIAAEILRSSIAELLQDRLLDKLFAHAAIKGKLKALQLEMEDSRGSATQKAILSWLKQMRAVLVDYF